MGVRKPTMVTMALFQVLITLSIWGLLVKASDPDPLSDYASGVVDFVFRDVFKNGDITTGPGGVRAALNTSIFPALIAQGITYVHFMLEPCGVNRPHTHPHATELLTLIGGGPIQAGFVDTSGTPHIYILKPGDIIIFPRAMMHYELNVGNETAFFVSALNSQRPGVLTSAGATLMIPDRAAASAFNIDLYSIRKLKKKIYHYDDSLVLDKYAGCVPGRDITTDI